MFLLLGTVLAAQAPVSVYVFTKPSEFVDAESKGRMDAAADLVKSLAKKKTLRLVTKPDDAAIQIEVIRRGNDPIGTTSERTTRVPPIAGGGTSSTTTQDKQYTVHTLLIVGEYTTPIVGSTSGVLWRLAADDAADQIDKWVKTNRAKLSTPTR